MSAANVPHASPEPTNDAAKAWGPGATIDRYTVEALIGRGGMGEVYRALDTRLRRKVALKVLRPDRDRPDAVARLFREARAAAALTHPNAITIHDMGDADGLFYIVMELVTGAPLLAYVGDERIPLARRVRWITDIARALAAAHRAGVLHRDVKPSNVMISEDDIAKVLDFGLAKPAEPMSLDFRTQVGHVVGTVRYMAPEQLAGQAEPRSDQYSLGLTAYELIAGKYPTESVVDRPSLDAIVPGFPAEGARVIARMIQPRPEARFPSMDDVVTALEDAIHGRQARLPAGDRAEPTEPTPVAPTAPAPPTAPTPPTPRPVGEAQVADTMRAPSKTVPLMKTLATESRPKGLEWPPQPQQTVTKTMVSDTAVINPEIRTEPQRRSQTKASATKAAPSYPPPKRRRDSKLGAIALVLMLMTFAAFLGTYLGARARSAPVPPAESGATASASPSATPAPPLQPQAEAQPQTREPAAPLITAAPVVTTAAPVKVPPPPAHAPPPAKPNPGRGADYM